MYHQNAPAGKSSNIMRELLRLWQKLTRLKKSASCSAFECRNPRFQHWERCSVSDDDQENVAYQENGLIADGFEVVLIGKSKRRFVVKSSHVKHPLFSLLIQRSQEFGVDQSQGLTLGCEVVLFKHLLWMLETEELNVSQAEDQTVQELAEFYVPKAVCTS